MSEVNNVTIGKNVFISENAVINNNVIIEDDVIINDFCIIGSKKSNNDQNNTVIKKGSIINSHSIVNDGCLIGKNSIIGHHVLIREKSIIDNNVQIGSYSDIEGFSTIGEYTKLHSNVHIGQGSNIMSYCWLFPYVIITNDPIPPSNIRQGVTIEPFATICTRTTILPGKKIGFGSFVGANSLVNKNLSFETIGVGNPFKIRGKIDLIKIPNSNINAYPWAGRFEKDYPKNINEIYDLLKKKFTA